MDQLPGEFKRTSIFQIKATPDSVVQQIDLLRDIDKRAEEKQKIGCVILGVAVALMLLGVFILATTSNPLGAIPLVLGIVALVGGIIFRSMAGKLNLPDRRYELLGNVIEAIRRDMSSAAILTARVDFRSPTHKSKFKEKGQIGPWKVSFYTDPWLTLQGRFLDSTSFQLEVTDLTQQRGQWKRSRSGKSKYKTKTKTATVASLRLKAKPEKYPELESYANQVASSAVLPDWCELKNSVVANDSLSMKVSTKEEWDVPSPDGKASRFHGGQMISLMFLSLYRVLNLCKGSMQ